MKNLKSVIRYECMTSFKYIWVFYGIQYAVVLLIMIIAGIITGSFKEIGTSCLESNTLIFVGVLGVLGFKEDFKMLIQNGFTRKYIFIATLSMFSFISGIMALVDTIAGQVFHYFYSNYISLYGDLYGYNNVFVNWLWLFLVYLTVCSLFYFAVLVINKLGKFGSIYLAIILGAGILSLAALSKFEFFYNVLISIGKFFTRAMGFMSDGTINHIFPILTLLVITAVFGAGSYMVVRRTELK